MFKIVLVLCVTYSCRVKLNLWLWILLEGSSWAILHAVETVLHILVAAIVPSPRTMPTQIPIACVVRHSFFRFLLMVMRGPSVIIIWSLCNITECTASTTHCWGVSALCRFGCGSCVSLDGPFYDCLIAYCIWRNIRVLYLTKVGDYQSFSRAHVSNCDYRIGVLFSC